MGSGHEGCQTWSLSAPGRYNCKEEFQIHDELLKAHYTLGRLSDTSPEHYLVQVRSDLSPPVLLHHRFSPLPLLTFPTVPSLCFTVSPQPLVSSSHLLSPPGFLGPIPPALWSSCSSLSVHPLPGPSLPTPHPYFIYFLP